MKVEISPNPKKVKVFLGKDGQVYEGSIYEEINGVNNRGPAGADRLPEGIVKEKTTK